MGEGGDLLSRKGRMGRVGSGGVTTKSLSFEKSISKFGTNLSRTQPKH